MIPTIVVPPEKLISFMHIFETMQMEDRTEEQFMVSFNALLSDYDQTLADEGLTTEEVYNILGNRKDLSALEFNIYCWVCIELGVRPKINFPFTEPIEDSTLEAFKKEYLFSEKRRTLFNELERYILQIKNEENIIEIEVLVGGSFTDITVENPNDIDICILVSAENKGKKSFDFFPHPEMVLRPLCVDNKFLPKDFSLGIFKAYSRIVHLGNKILKDDKGVEVIPKQFVVRQIKSINF